MKKIAIIVGTRPEAIKLVPVYQNLATRNDCSVTLISSGQHSEMLKQIFDFFKVKPDLDLKVMTADQSLAGLTSLLFSKVDQVVDQVDPDVIVVQGDTTTAMVASMIGFYRNIKVAHVEAGLRTHNIRSPFPEEVNRKIISCVADYNFAPTEKALQALNNEQVSNSYLVGNTVIDSLLDGYELVKENLTYYHELFNAKIESDKKLILVTSHRRESFGQGFQNICRALAEIAEKHKAELQILYPVHFNPNVRESVFQILSDKPNIVLIDPVPYDQMIYLMSRSFMILTDSGGIQEEAPSMGVPVVVMRDTTERPEGIEAGCAILAGNDYQGIMDSFEKIYNDSDLHQAMSDVENPYGDGNASKRIVKILCEDH